MDSHGISRVPRYSGTCPASQITVIYRAVTVCGRSFQIVRLAKWLVTCRPCGLTGPTTPKCKHSGLGYVRVRSPLLAESLLFSFPLGTEMVHFPRFAPMPYLFRQRYTSFTHVGSPIRRSAGQRMLAPYRSFSQLATSFIASKCQGIHRVPLVA